MRDRELTAEEQTGRALGGRDLAEEVWRST